MDKRRSRSPLAKPKSRGPSNCPSGLTYRQAGVDIDRANQAKERIRDLARSTFTSGVVRDLGAFAGSYRPDLTPYHTPVLVSSVDGVGTKLKVAFLASVHHTVGIDLVAHCTNDILVLGALPLFFLDYIATGKLEPQVIEEIVQGLAQGCRDSECALLGGETAEMPEFYTTGEYDLAGFMVGIVDESRLFKPEWVKKNDVLIGLSSSGLHTNGYSLVREIFFEQEKLKIDSYVADLDKSIGEELLIPHRNYLPVIKDFLGSDDLHGLAHITGGGITQNLARILPQTLDAQVDLDSWKIPAIFELIQNQGQVEKDEMFRTFNMGLGMILVVAQEGILRAEEFLRSCTEPFHLIGEISEGCGQVCYR